MGTKQSIRRIFDAIAALWIIKLPFLMIDGLVRRSLWLWSYIRLAVKIRNRGEGCVCHWNAELKYPENIILGHRVVIGINAVIGAKSTVTLGDDVRISRDVMIETAGLDFINYPPPYKHYSNPIEIQDGAWIGARAIILGGVTIGKGAIIAAGSVVTRDIPDGAVVAGSPAKAVGAGRKLSDSEK
jgi:maltose O-acetyltransferase